MFVFQLPDYIPLENRLIQNYLRPRSRLFSLFSILGVDKAYLYEKLDLRPAQMMNNVPKNQMLFFLASIDAKVLDLEIENLEIGGRSVTYYVTK